MNGTLVINDRLFPSISMPKIKSKKKKVMTEIKGKLEQAKLNLIYTQLEELQIPFNRDCTTVKELTKSLKSSLGELDYGKAVEVIDKVNASLDGMVDSLEKGSTNAFTKLMTSDLAKTIGKSLGISLAGRTALILAPTIGTKALVAAGLGAYSLYRVVKSRKQIIKANQENELNNILMELETTKEEGEIRDTRFNEDAQQEIRNYLKSVGVEFDDTGYRSLREAVYSLDADKKKTLCNIINNKLGKGINVDERYVKAKRKLNVAATTATNVGIGFGIGSQIANTINSIDPALGAGVLNGTVLGAWVEAQTQSKWYGALVGSLGWLGSEVAEHLPFIGGFAQKFFAAENLAACCAIGATGGLVASGALTVASIAKNIHSHIKANRESKKFVEMDAKKYAEVDKKELELIREKLHEPQNEIELVVIDIVLGYLKEDNIVLSGNPKSIVELNSLVNQLNGEEKKKAKEIVLRITDEINNNPSFVSQLKQAGQISIGLFTAGLAVMSVYDIIKGGTFLPELSRKIFPTDNVHNHVLVPDSLDKPLDPNNHKDASIISRGEETYNQLNGEDFKTEYDGDYLIDYGGNYGEENGGINAVVGAEMAKTGGAMNIADGIVNWFLGLIGKEEIVYESVPNIPKITELLEGLEPQKLYEFYRFYNNMPNDGSDLYRAVGEILNYNSFLEKASTYINGFQETQNIRFFINDLSAKVATGAIPLAVALEALGIIEKGTTSKNYKVEESHGLGK